MTFGQKIRLLPRRYGVHCLALFVLWLLVHDVFGRHGFLEMRRKRKEIQQVSSDIDRLNKENALLQEQRQELRTDPQAIEKIAREQLKQARPGEIVIELPPDPPAQPAPAAKP